MRAAAAALFAGAAALALAACGGTEEPPDTPVTISLTRAPDSLDPALASDPAARESLWLVYTPLLTYRHEDGENGAEVIPGLASDLPEVSDDGLTYEFDLRDDLTYPDGTEVRASDFEHAIERVRELRSPGARNYGRIARIETDDESGVIEIELSAPDRELADALALPYAAPVPRGTPVRDLSADPPPGVGPYEITAVDPDGGFVLKRDPTFPDLDIPDVPTGNLTEIQVTIDPSREHQAQGVLDGRLDYMHDPPPPDLAAQADDRLTLTPAAATAYFTLDTRLAPFDDPLVRQAVNTGIARAAISRLGSMQPGCALLAPGVPGYDRELDTTECPYGDPSKPLDLDVARALIVEAGAHGELAVVSAGDDAAERAAVADYASDLEAIGLRARIEQCASCAQTALVVADPEFPRPEEFLGRFSEVEPQSEDWRELDRHVVSPPQSYVAVLGHPTVTTFFSDRMDPGGTVVHPVFGHDYSSWQLEEGP